MFAFRGWNVFCKYGCHKSNEPRGFFGIQLLAKSSWDCGVGIVGRGFRDLFQGCALEKDVTEVHALHQMKRRGGVSKFMKCRQYLIVPRKFHAEFKKAIYEFSPP